LLPLTPPPGAGLHFPFISSEMWFECYLKTGTNEVASRGGIVMVGGKERICAKNYTADMAGYYTATISSGQQYHLCPDDHDHNNWLFLFKTRKVTNVFRKRLSAPTWGMITWDDSTGWYHAWDANMHVIIPCYHTMLSSNVIILCYHPITACYNPILSSYSICYPLIIS
jgi:hypothetical protein